MLTAPTELSRRLATPRARLEALLGAVVVIGWIGALAILGYALVRPHNTAYVLVLSGLLVVIVAASQAPLLVRIGHIRAGLILITVCIWLEIAAVVYLSPYTLPIVVLPLVAPVLISLEHASPRTLIALIAATCGVSALVSTLGAWRRTDLKFMAALASPAPYLLVALPAVAGVITVGLLFVLRTSADHSIQLASSRRRLSSAFDDARRSIERDLHDGAQQRLVAISVDLGRIRRHTTSAETAGEIAGVQTALTEAIQELRDLAHGIYPPLLLERGLPAALPAAGRRSSIPCTVHVDTQGRYDPAIESAVYFSCLEAIQNATKHSGATTITVTVTDRDGQLESFGRRIRLARGRDLEFTVSDDGRGFRVDQRLTSPGLAGMRDRVRAAGGDLVIHSSPSTARPGTAVVGTFRGVLPVTADAPPGDPSDRPWNGRPGAVGLAPPRNV